MKGLQRLWYIFEKIKDKPQENALEEFKLEFSAKFLVYGKMECYFCREKFEIL